MSERSLRRDQARWGDIEGVKVKMCEGGMAAGWEASSRTYKRNGEGGREVVQGLNSGEVRGSMAAEVADKFLAR